MSVEGARNSRRVIFCLLTMFAVTAAPASALAQDIDTQTYYDFEPPPDDMPCSDKMIEEPYADERVATPIADADDACIVPDLPIST
jgi:hypothetical protein